MKKNKKQYLTWLLSIVHVNDDYRYLMTSLLSVPFEWSVENDANRNDDGLELREQYFGVPTDIFGLEHGDEICSVLEMMIALASRMEHEVVGDPDGDDNTFRWFWSMIETMGLSEVTNDVYDEKYVHYIIQNVMDRKYDFDGSGGLFYVPYAEFDMRSTELWVQAMWYLNQFG